MEKHTIFGVHITDRVKKAGDVQRIFTEYGCNIKTRLGLHEARENVCGTSGFIILEMVGDDKVCSEMFTKLKAVEGVEVQRMMFG